METQQEVGLWNAEVQALLGASQYGDIQYVEELLNTGLPIECEDSNGNTPLQVAAANGHERVVELLLRRCAAVDHANNCGWTPLIHAAYHGHIGVVDILLHNKAKVNEANKLGLKPLLAAICGGFSATVRLLLDAGAAVDAPESSDFTPLMASALYGHEEIVCHLLDRGASVNQAACSTKLTPLMMAACGGFKPIAQRLVECGADTNAMNVCCHTALDVAVACGKWEVKAYLSDKTHSSYSSANKSAEVEMMENVKQGNLSVVQSLLDRQVELVNWCQSDGATPLMEAAIVGQVELVKFLVNKGAALDQQDKKNGWSALMQAVYHEHMDVVQYLLISGASVDLLAFDGYTALDLAWLLEKPNVAQFLLEWKEKIETSISGKFPDFILHKPSSMKSSLRWKQSRNNSFKTLLGQVATRFQQFKSPRMSASSSPGGMDETRFCVGNTNKASPVTMLKLSSFHLSKKEGSDQSKPWDMPVNPPLLPSKGTTAAFSCQLPPRCKMPKQEFYPVHLLRRHRKVQEVQNASIKPNFYGNHVLSFESPISQKEAKFTGPISVKTASPQRGKLPVGSVDSLLKDLSLDRYIEKIKHHEIDLDTFASLTEEDLEEIGISYGPREQLLSAIRVLKNEKHQQ